ncbi:MAG TPA: hypothetical protein VEG38_21090, partial [Acidimicrobiia bacterium]|nr:hypothetical protein [Acidimicrobiia bacterium]
MTDLWTEASRDTEREQREQRFTAARVAVAPLWPFLAGAVSETDFENRLAVSADKIDAVCERLAEGAEFTALRRQVHTALQRDYAILAEAAAEERRQAFLERKRARLAAQRKKAEAESDLEEGTHVEPRSSEESRADGKGNPVDDTRHAGNTPEGGDHVGPKEDCPVCSGGSKESAKVASGPPIIPDNVGARDMSPKTLAQQIGTMNIMAISGGRV